MLCTNNIQPTIEPVQFDQQFIKNIDNVDQYSNVELARMYAEFLWMDPNEINFDCMTEGGVVALQYQFEHLYFDDLPF